MSATPAWIPLGCQMSASEPTTVMLAAGVVSAIFLVTYVTHKVLIHGVNTPFGGQGPIRTVYYVMLFTHIVLAMAISGGLAALAGAIEVLGVTDCHCQQVLFTTGTGFDAIAIAPYFGSYLGDPEQAPRVRSMSLDQLFAEIDEREFAAVEDHGLEGRGRYCTHVTGKGHSTPTTSCPGHSRPKDGVASLAYVPAIPIREARPLPS